MKGEDVRHRIIPLHTSLNGYIYVCREITAVKEAWESRDWKVLKAFQDKRQEFINEY